MKKAIDIKREIAENAAKQKSLEEKQEQILDNLYSSRPGNIKAIREWKISNEAEIKAAEAEVTKIDREIVKYKVRQQVLRDNYKAAFIAENLPIALNIIHKYDNKPLGEKTREKILDQMKEEANCYIRIENDNIHLAEYGFGYSNGYDIYGKRNYPEVKRIVSLENKIVPGITEEDFCTPDNYAEDVNGKVDSIIAKYEEAKAAFNHFAEMAKEYNSIKAGDMRRIEEYARIDLF